jgi:hypothetical protein
MTGSVKLTREYLAELGLGGLSDDDQTSLLAAIYVELERRVGTQIASTLTTAQLDEFDALMATGDEQACVTFLSEHVPGYQETVRKEHARLTDELKRRVPQILAARVPTI